MKIILKVLVLFFLSLPEQSIPSAIGKRGVLDFARMIRKVTGRKPSHFNRYGRYCGLGGTGDPIDAIDRCCRNHDNCYDVVANDQCSPYPSSAIYVFHYKWSIKNETITCKGAGFVGDLLNFTACSNALCRCDKAAVECFQMSPYNATNKRHPFYSIHSTKLNQM